MDALTLVRTLQARGVELAADGDRLRFRPVDALTPADLEALRAMKPAILAMLRAAPDSVTEARDLRAAWWGACFELAEALGWPVLEVRPGVDTGPGECLWRLYLTRAALPELRDRVLPALRERLSTIGRPREAA